MRLGRRRFLTALAGAAAYTALRPHLALARRAARPWPNLQPWSLPAEPPSGIDLARALIGAAVLAPSQWNTQPWRFEVEGDLVRIVADTARTMPVIDPDRRGLVLSIGAALENLLVAARAYGLRPAVDLLPDGGARGVMAQVSWTGGEAPRDLPLFAAITRRRTNRRDYDGRGVVMQDAAQLIAQSLDGCTVHWLDDRDAIRALGDVAFEAERSRILDKRAQAERFSWMRLDEGDARRRADGVQLDALAFGGPAHWFAGLYFNPRSRFLRLGADSAGKQARSQVRSSGGLALLTSQRRGEAAWLLAGQMLARFSLRATSLGLAHHVMATPLQLERTRVEVVRRFGAGGEEPLLMVRLGHQKAPAASHRRAVALVSSYRTS